MSASFDRGRQISFCDAGNGNALPAEFFGATLRARLSVNRSSTANGKQRDECDNDGNLKKFSSSPAQYHVGASLFEKDII